MKTNSILHRQKPAISLPQKDTRQAGDGLPEEDESDAGYPDMTKVCRILARQVETLDAMFHHARELALQEDGPTEAFERLSRLALRAQAQTARTAAVLRHLCPPPIVEEEPDPYEEAFLKAVLGDGPEFQHVAAQAPSNVESPLVLTTTKTGDRSRGPAGLRSRR